MEILSWRMLDNRKIFLCIVWAFLIFTSINFISALANPLAVSCEKKGGTYVILNDSEGNDYGTCLGSKFLSTKISLQQDVPNNKSEIVSSFLTLSVDGDITSDSLKSGAFLSSFDWRNKSGLNWVSPVKDQGSEGTCWAFAAVGIVESRAKIDINNSLYSVDLSEQDVAACNPNSSTSSWDGGYVYHALDYITNGGITTESLFPYTGHDTLCSNKPENSPVIKTSSYALIASDADSIKQAINDYGPITVNMYADCDFLTYSGGVYTHEDITWCAQGGLHAVEIVGYNDTGNYWICKNSWGTGWGESGFFKMNYSENVESLDDWYDPNDNRTFYLGGSYYVPSTSILQAPSISNASSNLSYVESSTPINFSVYVQVNSIKTLTNVTLNDFTMSGNLSSGGLFSIVKTPAELGCQQNSDENCSLTVNASDDAGIQNFTLIVLRVKDIMAEPTIISPLNNSWLSGLRFNVTISDSGNCSFSLNHGANITMNASNSTSFFYVNSSIGVTLTNSTYNITFYCNDDLGNFNSSSMIFFGIEKTAPVLNSSSYSKGSSSAIIYYTSNESIIADINYGTSMSLGSISSNQDFLESGSITLNSLSASTLYYYNLTICDFSGNCAVNGTYNFTTDSAPASSGGGGGGGGSTSVGITYSPSLTEMAVGYTKELAKNDKISFIPFSGGSHSMTLNNVASNSVQITVRSNPIDVTLFLGAEKKLSLNSSDYYDLYLKLNSVENNKANITMKSIYELIPKVYVNNSEINSSKVDNAEQNTSKNSNNKLYIYAIVIVLIAIIPLIFARLISNKKNETIETLAPRTQKISSPFRKRRK